MRPYFEKMPLIGRPLTDAQKQSGKENVAMSFTVSATDPDGDILTYSAANLL